jgi:hypothetical protein
MTGRADEEMTMRTLSPVKAGITLGAILGGFHLVWALLVAAGWAQLVLDFVFWLHFIKPVYSVARFDTATAALLVGFAACVGFAGAYSAGVMWNQVQRIDEVSRPGRAGRGLTSIPQA